MLSASDRQPAKSRTRGRISASLRILWDLEWELGSVYDAIRTLQLEYQVGRVPEALYQEQSEAYRFQAAGLLRQQAQGQALEVDPDLEQEILQARSNLRASDGVTLCPQCGTRRPDATSHCPKCNAEL